jgi:sugar O-acyltransferase (sialic acid O-acetyltransferase NeuD family)
MLSVCLIGVDGAEIKNCLNGKNHGEANSKMSSPVIVYGSKFLAEMLYYDSLKHPDFKIEAFAADEGYVDETGFYLGLPMVAMETITERYPPTSYDMIVLTTSFHDMRDREGMYTKAKSLGYTLRNYISPSSIVSTGTEMGDNNIIFEQAFLGHRGRMGSSNIIRQQVYVGHEFTVGNNNVITSGCTIGGECRIENNCYIGLNATILNKITVSEESLVGAGSVVIRNTEPFSRNVGNPSRVLSYHKEGLKVNL